MPKSQAIAFFEEISKNNKLAQEVEKVAGGKTSNETKAKELLSLAKDHGFNFTKEEAVSAQVELKKSLLPEEMLEVSGGKLELKSSVMAAVMLLGLGVGGATVSHMEASAMDGKRAYEVQGISPNDIWSVEEGDGSVVTRGIGRTVVHGDGPSTITGHGLTTVVGNGPIDSSGGGDIESNGKGNIKSNGDGHIDSRGNGNIESNGNGSIESNGGGNIESNGDANIVSNGDGDIESNGDGNIESNGGGNIVSNGDGRINSYGDGRVDVFGNGRKYIYGNGMTTAANKGPIRISRPDDLNNMLIDVSVPDTETNRRNVVINEAEVVTINDVQKTNINCACPVSRGDSTVTFKDDKSVKVDSINLTRVTGPGNTFVSGPGKTLVKGGGTTIVSNAGRAVVRDDVSADIEGDGDILVRGSGDITSTGSGEITSAGSGAIRILPPGARSSDDSADISVSEPSEDTKLRNVTVHNGENVLVVRAQKVTVAKGCANVIAFPGTTMRTQNGDTFTLGATREETIDNLIPDQQELPQELRRRHRRNRNINDPRLQSFLAFTMQQFDISAEELRDYLGKTFCPLHIK